MKSKDIHDKWKSAYRTSENSKFYELACNVISEYFEKTNGLVLDAGCGTGEKSMHLSMHGYEVVGVDIAQVALIDAQKKCQENHFSDKIKLMQVNLQKLAFSDAAFGAIVIWGVLMHVPNLEEVVAELCRVLKPGGKIVIYDANPKSLDVRIMTMFKNLSARNKSTSTNLGIENWFESNKGPVLVRWTHYSIFKNLFHKYGVKLQRRRAGQFTEFYVYFNNALLRVFLHKINNFYFRVIRWHLPSYANMIFGQKTIKHPQNR